MRKERINKLFKINPSEKILKLSSIPIESDKELRKSLPYKGWEIPSEGLNKIEQALYRKFGLIGDSKLFINKNKDILEDIISKYGTPTYLGTGGSGIVFKLSSGKVLKIYADYATIEEDKYKLTKNILSENKNYAESEPMIFAHGSFKKSDNSSNNIDFSNNIKWVVMEYFMPLKLDSELRDCVAKYNTLMDKYFAGLGAKVAKKVFGYIPEFFLSANINLEEIKNNYPLLIKVAQELKKGFASDYMAMIIKDQNKQFGLADDWLEKFIYHYFFKMVTNRGDLHSGNLGIRPSTGYLVYFDV